jgi:hypothetical protein
MDPTRPEAVIARRAWTTRFNGAAGCDPDPHRDVAFHRPGGRYIDFLMPGILGMNIMSGGMWGSASTSSTCGSRSS